MGVLRYFFDFLFPCPALHISMGPSHSSVLRIGSDSTEASSSGRKGGESNSLAMVVHWVAPREPAFPLDKGKGKISEIQYPSSSKYLRAAIQNVVVVSLSQVEPSYGKVFAARYCNTPNTPLGRHYILTTIYTMRALIKSINDRGSLI